MGLRRAIAVLLLLTALVAGWATRRIEVDNRLERWLIEGGQEGQTYDTFRRNFGSDEFLLVVISGGDILSPASLDLMLGVVEQLESVPGITGVRGIPTVYRDLFGGEDSEALAEEITSTPFYRDVFISGDGKSAGLLVQVDPGSEVAARHHIVTESRRATAVLLNAGHNVRLVGSPPLMVALDEVSESETRRTLRIALLGSLLMLVLMLRSVRATVIAGLCAFISVTLTLGIAVAVGISFNMVTSALPPLLWVLALSNSIHILRRYQDLRIDQPLGEALRSALAETTRPCTLAAITTAAGFASLTVADMAPVSELGWLAAIGILLSLAVNLTVAPLMVELLRAPPFRHHLRTRNENRWNWGWRNHPRRVLAVTVISVVAALIVIPTIRVESDPVGFLPSDHPTSSDFRSLSGGLGGFHTLEVVLQAPGPWYAPEIWPLLDEVSSHISTSPIVSRVISPVDLLRKLNHWENEFDPAAYRPPETLIQAEELLSVLDGEGERMLRELVLEDQRTVRLSALVNVMEEHRFLGLVEETRDVLGELPSTWESTVTGQVLLLVNAQQNLITTQLRSLVLAMLLIAVCIAIGLRSWQLTTTALFPNLVPAVAVFALMALLRLPLDPATVMVASIALGIAVDNTVHVLENVRRRRATGISIQDATSQTLSRIGPAMAATTATACTGFLALSTSKFTPIGSFGLLAAGAMVVALAADVILLPAILQSRKS